MSLKTKFTLIIISLILIPPLTIVLQLAIQRNLSSGSPETSFIAIRMLARNLNTAVASGNFDAFSALPEGTELAIAADTGEVLYASPEGLANKEAVIRSTTGAVDKGQGVEGAGLDLHIFRFSSGGTTGTAYLTTPGGLAVNFGNPALLHLPITLGFFLVAISIFAGSVIRRLGVSIRQLEDATRRIALGDLDSSATDGLGDLASLGLAMDRMRIQLKEDRERRDRFIMGVSHDLKTPLAVIKGYLDALDDGMAENAGQRTHYIGIMRDRTDILATRIDHLIELSHTTTTEWRHGLQERDFFSFLNEALDPLAEYCTVRGCKLQRNLPSGPGPILAFDPDMVTRVLENLVENAIAYGDKGRPISVKAVPTATGLELRVENEGGGIPATNLRKVFEPFFRGTKGRNDGGFGLGLASVQSIVESHGWAIRAESIPGGKTSFIIDIPR
ncbi:MAG: ATP-binding protein [Clostridia bacterium]|jgi:signal transduction histidine kinase|nr:HAMP domain-containing sensor histidine kinase [Spirochaetia bacterium]